MRSEYAHETLHEYEHTADALLTVSPRPAVERAARVLALYVGHYQRRHGLLSPTELSIPACGPLTAEQLADRVEAMRVLAAALVLAGVVDALPDEPT
jgi:hypothetical protein